MVRLCQSTDVSVEARHFKDIGIWLQLSKYWNLVRAIKFRSLLIDWPFSCAVCAGLTSSNSHCINIQFITMEILSNCVSCTYVYCTKRLATRKSQTWKRFVKPIVFFRNTVLRKAYICIVWRSIVICVTQPTKPTNQAVLDKIQCL